MDRELCHSRITRMRLPFVGTLQHTSSVSQKLRQCNPYRLGIRWQWCCHLCYHIGLANSNGRFLTICPYYHLLKISDQDLALADVQPKNTSGYNNFYDRGPVSVNMLTWLRIQDQCSLTLHRSLGASIAKAYIYISASKGLYKEDALRKFQNMNTDYSHFHILTKFSNSHRSLSLEPCRMPNWDCSGMRYLLPPYPQRPYSPREPHLHLGLASRFSQQKPALQELVRHQFILEAIQKDDFRWRSRRDTRVRWHDRNNERPVGIVADEQRKNPCPKVSWCRVCSSLGKRIWVYCPGSIAYLELQLPNDFLLSIIFKEKMEWKENKKLWR